MNEKLKNIASLLSDNLKQTLHGVTFVSPLIGALTGYGMHFTNSPFAHAASGLWAGPLAMFATVGFYAVASNGFVKTFNDAKSLTKKDIINFIKPSNLVPRIIQSFKTGYKSAVALLPTALGSSVAAFGAVTLTPGVALSSFASAAALFTTPALLIPALALTLGGYVAGHMIGSKISQKITGSPATPFFSRIEGNGFMEKATSAFGRIMPYHTKNDPTISQRHPLSAIAMLTGVATAGLLSAVFGGAVLPIAMLGTVLGSALTLPLQEKVADGVRLRLAGVTPADEDLNPGVSPAPEPQPTPQMQPTPGMSMNNDSMNAMDVMPEPGPYSLGNLTLTDKFGRRTVSDGGQKPVSIPPQQRPQTGR